MLNPQLEIEMKIYIFIIILKSFQNQELSKLQYLYLEYFDELEENSSLMVEKLLGSMNDSLDKKHFDLYELLLLLARKKKV